MLGIKPGALEFAPKTLHPLFWRRITDQFRPVSIVNCGEQLPVVSGINCDIFGVRDEQLASEYRR